jgi:hypothetical protein
MASFTFWASRDWALAALSFKILRPEGLRGLALARLPGLGCSSMLFCPKERERRRLVEEGDFGGCTASKAPATGLDGGKDADADSCVSKREACDEMGRACPLGEPRYERRTTLATGADAVPVRGEIRGESLANCACPVLDEDGSEKK